MLGLAKILAMTSPSALVSCPLKRHNHHLLTDSSKRAEEALVLLHDLIAMKCNHHMYGRLWCNSRMMGGSRRT